MRRLREGCTAVQRPDLAGYSINSLGLTELTQGLDSLLYFFVPLYVDRLVAFQPGKSLDGFPGLLLGEAQVVEALQVEPKLRAGAKEMSEAQSGVARNSARPIQDLRDAIGGHVDLSRQLSRAHIERLQFFGQVFTRMDSSDGHSDSPSDSQQSQRSMALATCRATRSKSAIDRLCGCCTDPCGRLPAPQNDYRAMPQGLSRTWRLQTVELQTRGTFKPRECLDPFPGGEVSGALVPVTDDHWLKIAGIMRYV